MPDEFGTMNLRRNERAREIEVIRQQYKRHRDALTSMIADAPTQHLANEYQRLIGELDSSLRKISELEAPVKTPSDTQPMSVKSEPGTRPLVTTSTAGYDVPPDTAARGNRSLLLAIVGAGLIVLLVLGWLMWRASSDERPDTPIVTETTPVDVPENTTIVPVPPEPAPPTAASLRLDPASHDFGTIRKGTRAVRQYELSNTSEQSITITVSRSNCRCLYYSHAPVIPPKGKETITVTVDGARAKVGSLQETVKVSAKNNPAVAATLNVSATIR